MVKIWIVVRPAQYPDESDRVCAAFTTPLAALHYKIKYFKIELLEKPEQFEIVETELQS